MKKQEAGPQTRKQENFLSNIAITPKRLRNYSAIFMFCLAFFCLFMAFFYWIRLIGVFSGTLWRFDLMPWQWQILSVSMAVLYPVASCGLWTGSRWGLVLWFIGAAIETLCFTVYFNNFVWNPWIPIFHILFLSCYCVRATLLYFHQSKKPDTLVEY